MVSEEEFDGVEIDLSSMYRATNDIYYTAYEDNERYLIFYGGAGSGKSRFVGQKLLYRMLNETNHRILVVRKVATTLRKSVFQLMVDYIYKYGLQEFFKIRTGDLVIECANGNQMYFLGLDDVEKLKSIEGVTAIWMEEASEITEDDFTQLNLRLRGETEYYKQIIISFNPISQHHWLKKRFFDYTAPDIKIYHTTYKDNEFIDDIYIKMLHELRATNPRYYEIYALGKWGVLKGKIFKDFIEIDKMPEDKELDDISWGMDFGSSVPSTLCKCGIIGNDLYLDERIYQAGLTNPQLIRMFRKEAPELVRVVGFGDSAEPARIQDFRNNDINMHKAIKEVLFSIDVINSYDNIYITKASTNLIMEWESYSWKTDKDGNLTDNPVKKNDHIVDAVRYGVYSKWGITRDSNSHITNKVLHSIKKFSGY